MGTLRLLAAMAWRNLWSHKGKNILVGILMLFGTFLVVLGTSVLDSIDQAMTRSITQSVAGHLQVYSKNARDPLALYGSGYMGADDLGVMPDFARVKAVVSAVPGVRAVIPMGMDAFEIYTATELDYAIERLRKALEAGEQARVDDVARRIRAMATLLREELERRKLLLSNHAEIDRQLAIIDRVRGDAFWAELPAAPLAGVEYLDTQLAPLVDENEGYFLQVLGTDVQRFAQSFGQFELVSGQMIPEGERGVLLNQKYYDDYLRNMVARGFDARRRDIEEKGKRFADDPLMRAKVERMVRQYRRVTFQLEPAQAEELAAKLRAFLPGAQGSIDELVQQFLRLDDQNFAARYEFFFDEIAPRIRLYLFNVGETLTVRAFTRSGMIKSANVKVWGTFRFKGLEKSELAGGHNLMDMMTFRDLYGLMTADKRAELAGIQAEVGLKDVGRDSAEAELFGGGAAVEQQREQAQGFDEFAGVALGGRERAQANGHFDPALLDQGMAINAAIILDDIARLEEARGAVQAALDQAGLDVQVVDWETASGIIGQVVVLVRVVLYIAIGIIFLVALVIINNTMVMATMERVMEIGTMRAIGAQASLVRWLLLLETLMLGLLSGALGAALGYWLVSSLGTSGIPAPADELIFLFAGPRLFPAAGLGNVLAGFAAIVVVSLLAILYPATIATRIQPVVAMSPRE
ncbi:MAG TPA: FtsX-like permease family protein [Myxococcota bacterium]|nr:FtsX-like permease family protein [Myxococcota bacterium]HRY97178.1 FtsX-like permease family protein [Myxococcota bacterium]HSA21132.1 FtsX-like permease family protein [Myxococcota bacterium]